MTNKIFPTLLIILDICAAAGYIPDGDWRKIIYWLAAATLTFTVTW
jgi:DNA transposition AAA+ family ATPase